MPFSMASNTHDYRPFSPSLRPSNLAHRPRTPTHALDRPVSGANADRSSPSSSPSMMRPANAAHASTATVQHRSRHDAPRLPALPRFHPANYASSSSTSAASSNNVSPDAILHSSSGPLSPRTSHQLRQYSEAQRQLYMYHRELVNLNRSHGSTAAASGVASPSWRSSRPVSPQLKPLGSPGPITPLELEVEADQSEGYLMAGAGAGHARASGDPLSETAKEEILEGYIRKETQVTAMDWSR